MDKGNLSNSSTTRSEGGFNVKLLRREGPFLPYHMRLYIIDFYETNLDEKSVITDFYGYFTRDRERKIFQIFTSIRINSIQWGMDLITSMVNSLLSIISATPFSGLKSLQVFDNFFAHVVTGEMASRLKTGFKLARHLEIVDPITVIGQPGQQSLFNVISTDLPNLKRIVIKSFLDEKGYEDFQNFSKRRRQLDFFSLEATYYETEPTLDLGSFHFVNARRLQFARFKIKSSVSSQYPVVASQLSLFDCEIGDSFLSSFLEEGGNRVEEVFEFGRCKFSLLAIEMLFSQHFMKNGKKWIFCNVCTSGNMKFIFSRASKRTPNEIQNPSIPRPPMSMLVLGATSEEEQHGTESRLVSDLITNSFSGCSCLDMVVILGELLTEDDILQLKSDTVKILVNIMFEATDDWIKKLFENNPELQFYCDRYIEDEAERREVTISTEGWMRKFLEGRFFVGGKRITGPDVDNLRKSMVQQLGLEQLGVTM